jgi:hypothetical protein
MLAVCKWARGHAQVPTAPQAHEGCPEAAHCVKDPAGKKDCFGPAKPGAGLCKKNPTFSQEMNNLFSIWQGSLAPIRGRAATK